MVGRSRIAVNREGACAAAGWLDPAEFFHYPSQTRCSLLTCFPCCCRCCTAGEAAKRQGGRRAHPRGPALAAHDRRGERLVVCCLWWLNVCASCCFGLALAADDIKARGWPCCVLNTLCWRWPSCLLLCYIVILPFAMLSVPPQMPTVDQAKAVTELLSRNAILFSYLSHCFVCLFVCCRCPPWTRPRR